MENFYQRFTDIAARYPERTALELQRASSSSAANESYTYAELRRIAEHLGAWLQSSGLASGSRCAILANNGPRWVAAYLGVMAAGCVAVPLDTAFNEQQVAKLLKDSSTSLLFVDSDHVEIAQGAWASISTSEPIEDRLFLIDSASDSRYAALDKVLLQAAAHLNPSQRTSDDLAVLLYTSGTTSDPKGVMLTQKNLVAEADSVFRVIQVGPDDTILGVLPLFHALAQMGNLLLPLSIGAQVVYLEVVNTTELLRALEERGITLFACVPQFFYLIHERVMKQVQSRGLAARVVFRLLLKMVRVGRRIGFNLGKIFFAEAHRKLGRKMRYLITGGSRFDPKIGRDLEDMGFNVLQAYGLTETSGAATLTSPGEIVHGSVGKPLPGTEIRIAKSEQSDDGDLAGEIMVRGPIVMKGYYNRPDATTEVLKDGWLHTGDLGYVDRDGNVFVTGRSKDVIVLSSGKNVYPEEIEARYVQSPLIKEICVVGLESQPGEPLAERLHAVIVPNFDVLRERKVVNAREVLRFDIEGVSAQLPSTKRILSYDIWQEDLPRTTTRKLKRFEIRKRVLQKRSGGSESVEPLSSERKLNREDRTWLENAGVQQALAVMRQASKKQGDIHPDDNLELDLGLDSMERVELVVALESALGAHAEDSELANVYSVRELVSLLLRNQGGGNLPVRSGWDAVFAAETSDPEVMEALRPPAFATIFWFLAARLGRYVCQVLYRIKIDGLENIPRERSFIFSPNHQSFMDAPLIMSYFPYRIFRKMFYVGTSEIFGRGIRRRIARSMKLVPIDPDANLVPAMRAGAYGLRRGDALVLYPEGERSISGEPRTFKKGAAILATHLQVPIVPVAIDGFEKAWGRGRGIHLFQKLQIRIGGPIEPPPTANASEKTYESLTRDLKQKVMNMWLTLRGEQPLKPQLVGSRG
ncbi:MAG TPA: AMP-binding protein [Terriglobales bacterium]|nr:AMP-binding protein [Terriglobales bacterium]